MRALCDIVVLMSVDSHKQAWFSNLLPSEIVTLSVDCGGGGIKSTLIDAAGKPLAHPLRTAVQYPFTPANLVVIIADQLREQTSHTGAKPARITIGLPGIIRNGQIIYTPHYIRDDGPQTTVIAQLAAKWNGLQVAQLLEDHFGLPCLAINDAEVAACAVVNGIGSELVLTLGTGLGCALFVDGRLCPHIEMSHAPFMQGLTFDEALGEIARAQIGNAQWSERVLAALDALWPVFRWDHLFLGGGNTQLLTDAARQKLPASVTLIPNAAGANGGARAWDLLRR